MKLIVVTTPTFFVEEDKIITALFEEGLDILHLRKPETPAMYSERLLTLIPEKYHRRIVTHEHFYLKEEFNLMGIHLNARNPSEPHDYAGHVSCSCHSVEEVKNLSLIHISRHTRNRSERNRAFRNDSSGGGSGSGNTKDFEHETYNQINLLKSGKVSNCRP